MIEIFFEYFLEKSKSILYFVPFIEGIPHA